MSPRCIPAVPAILATSLLTACQSTGPARVETVRHGVAAGTDDAPTVELVRCDAPVATAAVAPIRCKASGCAPRSEVQGNLGALLALAHQQEGIPDLSTVGTGLRDMMQTALEETGCFEVLDRELMEDLREELALAGGGGDAPPLRTADYLVSGAITSIAYDKSEGGIGTLGLVPGLAALKREERTARLGMDLRLVEVATSGLAFSRAYTAESGKTTYGAVGIFGGLSGAGGGGFKTSGGREMEEVARDIVARSVMDMTKTLAGPGRYRVETAAAR